jgi:hypothetical protein
MTDVEDEERPEEEQKEPETQEERDRLYQEVRPYDYHLSWNSLRLLAGQSTRS